MTIRNELMDELPFGRDPSSVIRQDALLGELKKTLRNRLMAAEFGHHMAEDCAAHESHSRRNGSTRKHVLAGDGHVDVTVPGAGNTRPSPRHGGDRCN